MAPVVAQVVDHGLERFKIPGLYEIAVCVPVIRLGAITFGVGRCQNHHRNALQVLVLFERRQQIYAADLRQIEIQQDDVRSRTPRQLTAMCEIVERLAPVLDVASGVKKIAAFQIAQDQMSVVLVILDHQAVKRLGVH